MYFKSFLRDRADQLQKLQMTVIPNFLCALRHRGTNAANTVTDEMICVVDGENGVCSGEKIEFVS